MNCDRVRELLSEYLDDVLAPEEAAAMREHLASCAGCSAEFAALERTVELCRALDEVEVPAGFRASLHGRIAARSSRRGVVGILGRAYRRIPYKGLVAAAAVLIIAFATNTITLNLPSLPRMGAPAENKQSYGIKGEDVNNEGLSSRAEFSKTGEQPPSRGQPQIGTADGAGSMTFDEAVEQKEGLMPITGPVPGGQAAPPPFEQRKIIKNGELTLEVVGEKFDSTYREIIAVAEGSRGYVQQSSTTSEKEGAKRAQIILRVPEQSFGQVFDRLMSLATVLVNNISSQDVSGEYYDTRSRLRNFEHQEQRLLTIMGQARTIDEILRVEYELARVRGEIEVLKGRLEFLDSVTGMSTISVTLLNETAPAENPRPGILDQVWKAFLKSLDGLKGLGFRILVFVAAAAPFVALAALAWFGVRQFWRRKA